MMTSSQYVVSKSVGLASDGIGEDFESSSENMKSRDGRGGRWKEKVGF